MVAKDHSKDRFVVCMGGGSQDREALATRQPDSGLPGLDPS